MLKFDMYISGLFADLCLKGEKVGKCSYKSIDYYFKATLDGNLLQDHQSIFQFKIVTIRTYAPWHLGRGAEVERSASDWEITGLVPALTMRMDEY